MKTNGQLEEELSANLILSWVQNAHKFSSLLLHHEAEGQIPLAQNQEDAIKEGKTSRGVCEDFREAHEQSKLTPGVSPGLHLL